MILLDCLYNINKHLGRSNTIWDILQLKRVVGFIIYCLANYVLPIFLKRTNANLNEEHYLPIIVSITSFPARIGKVWMTIESILLQTYKPETVILWLSRKQFPNEFHDLPKRLLEQQVRGLTIRFVDDDIRSYKKFYYAFLDFKNKMVMTIDDDLLIPSYFLKNIYDCKLKHPDCVIASFGFRYKWDEKIGYIRLDNSKIFPNDSGRDLFFGSGGGTLFDTTIATKMDTIEDIRNICPTADDIYLNALIRICGMGVAFHMNNPLLSVKNKRNLSLVSHNGDIGDPNSENANQFKKLISYYLKKGIVNPFIVNNV